MNESERAVMESARFAAMESYFEARPQIAITRKLECIFEAGFDAAYAEVRRLRHQWAYYQDFCKQNGFDGITAMAVAVDKLRDENERLRKELAKLREQAPAGWVDADGDFYHGRNYPNVFPTAVPVYADPIPAPAVPYGVDEEAANRIALAVYDCKNDICPEPLLYAINRILATEAHPLSVEGRDALLPSAPQAPAVPELDPMTRLIVSDPKQPKPTALQAPAVPVYLLERQENGLSWYIGATTCFGGAWHWTADVNSAIRFSREEDAAACWNIIARHHIGIGGSGTTETTPKQHIFDVRTLLQSAEGSNAAADRLLEGGV